MDIKRINEKLNQLPNDKIKKIASIIEIISILALIIIASIAIYQKELCQNYIIIERIGTPQYGRINQQTYERIIKEIPQNQELTQKYTITVDEERLKVIMPWYKK